MNLSREQVESHAALLGFQVAALEKMLRLVELLETFSVKDALALNSVALVIISPAQRSVRFGRIGIIVGLPCRPTRPPYLQQRFLPVATRPHPR